MSNILKKRGNPIKQQYKAVSYTHLDVYKRQELMQGRITELEYIGLTTGK